MDQNYQWNKMPGESQRAYDLFQIYCKLGRERSLEVLQERVGYKRISMLKRWNTQWNWDERVKAWDQRNNQSGSDDDTEILKKQASQILIQGCVSAARKLVDLVEEGDLKAILEVLKLAGIPHKETEISAKTAELFTLLPTVEEWKTNRLMLKEALDRAERWRCSDDS